MRWSAPFIRSALGLALIAAFAAVGAPGPPAGAGPTAANAAGVAAPGQPAGGGPTTALAAGAQTRTLRFGSTMGLSDAGVFLARERGYFREQGIEVDLVPFQSGP